MKKFIFIFVFLIFILITFPKMILHAPFFDESFAWYKACEMNLYNFTAILEAEGHSILWYLFLMPFAKTNFAYPYSMFLVNYLFCLLSIYILWKKSPFDTVTKIIITFSFCFMSYFSIIARCYTIGVCGLFLLAAYNKDALKHPILYATLIGLTANTSAVGTIGASGFLFIFLYELFNTPKPVKQKDTNLAIIILYLLFGFLVHPYLIRFENHSLYHMRCYVFIDFLKLIGKVFFCCNIYFLISYLVCMFFILIQDGYNLTRSKFYLLNSHIILFLFLFFVHAGKIYHYFFFLIFIIISLWISNINFKEKFLPILFYISFAIILFTKFDFPFCIGSKGYKEFGESLTQHKEFSDSVFFIPEWDLRYPLMPYILKLNGTSLDIIMRNNEELYKPDAITNNNDYFYNEEGNALANEIRMTDNFYINKNTMGLINDFANKINKKVYIILISEEFISEDVELPKPELDIKTNKIYRIK